MNGYRLSFKRDFLQVIALTVFVGALPFIINASAYAGEQKKSHPLLDEYKQPVGLTYNAQARIQSAYIWRGLHAGGMNLQASANVGYGGLYADLWWNIGVTDRSFRTFQPEADLSIGFARWGLDVYLLYIHNFNCPVFDFGNYADKGNRLELNVRYTVSKKLPLSFLWGTRIAASDPLVETRTLEDGTQAKDTVRAWSSYAEISYTHALPDGFSLYGAIGFTPWKGIYNARGAALQNIEFRLRKDWEVAKRCGLMLQGQVVVNPFAPIDVILTNIAFGVYLK